MPNLRQAAILATAKRIAPHAMLSLFVSVVLGVVLGMSARQVALVAGISLSLVMLPITAREVRGLARRRRQA